MIPVVAAKIVGGSVGGIFCIALVMVVTVGLGMHKIERFFNHCLSLLFLHLSVLRCRKKDSTSTQETEQAEKGRSQV